MGSPFSWPSNTNVRLECVMNGIDNSMSLISTKPSDNKAILQIQQCINVKYKYINIPQNDALLKVRLVHRGICESSQLFA